MISIFLVEYMIRVTFGASDLASPFFTPGVFLFSIPYTQNNWQVKYLANRSKNAVGVTLIWRKAIAVSKRNSYRPEMALFKFGGLKIIRKTAKLNTLPIILHIR